MRTRFGLAVAAVGMLLAAGPVRAHHSAAAEFDASKSVKLTGTVTKIDWVNPHTIFYMDVAGPDGKVENWGWELPSPNELMRGGWLRTSMKVGDTISVEGSHARDGSNHAMAKNVTLTSTGKRLFSGAGPGQDQ